METIDNYTEISENHVLCVRCKKVILSSSRNHMCMPLTPESGCQHIVCNCGTHLTPEEYDTHVCKISDWVKLLLQAKACPSAISWCRGLGDVRPQQAWDACDRGDWMMWLLDVKFNTSAEAHNKLTMCVRDIVLTILPLVDDDVRERLSPVLDAIKDYCEGRTSVNALEAEETKLFGMAVVGYSAAAVSYVVGVATTELFFRPLAVSACSCAARAHGDQNKALKEFADIVRRHYPEAPASD